ncbi:MAG: glycosyltransferase family 2 protein [Nitrospirae bacterium]|nr:glycosyltransferase family 2 protein [Nitrospirota bacterium]
MAKINPADIFKRYVVRSLKMKLQPYYMKAANFAFEKRAYQAWIAANEPDTSALMAQRAFRFNYMPQFAVICVADKFECPTRMIASLNKQTYARWRLYILCNGGALAGNCPDIEKNIVMIDRALPPDEIISLVDGDFIVTIGQGGILSPFALYEIAASINANPTGEFFYSDEDSIIGGKRAAPHFKPDFSPDTLRSFNYIGQFSAIKRGLFFSEFFRSIEDSYALTLGCAFKAALVVHISKVLYHTVDRKKGTRNEEALSAHLADAGVNAELEQHPPGVFNVKYTIKATPLVSVIIPNKDNADLLARCVKSIIYKTTYDRYEIVIAENGSSKEETFSLYDTLKMDKRIKIIRWDADRGPFNYSRVNNYAARASGGEILLLLNNDIEVVNGDWLVNMLRHAVREEIGAVGAKLYYPDGTIQHGGIAVGVGGIAVEYYKGYGGKGVGYFNRLLAVHNVSAVTGACLMLKRELFDRVNGFDESFALAYNDVDLCLRLMAQGYRTVWTPYARLIHSESRTRGYETTPAQRQRLEEESIRFTSRWGHVLKQGDPYYNPNLSRKRGDFTVCSDCPASVRP